MPDPLNEAASRKVIGEEIAVAAKIVPLPESAQCGS